jgi:2-polyprenyl-6-methoxyphenol hydroxylase-like FAD-dependent oxidoreductase
MAPIIVVGAGPAGMMLAYQLASNGVPVRVLERHKSFDREFRGEFAQPSVLGALGEIGVLAELERLGRILPIRAIRMHLGTRVFASSLGADGKSAGQAVHQPSFLGLLHEQCSRFPHYQLDFGAPVSKLVREGEGVRGVVARRDGNEEEIRGRLVVLCNGRGSVLRKEIGADVDSLEEPYNLLWLRFDLSRQPNLVPETLDGYVLKKAFCVLYPTYGAKVQLMWRRLRKYPLDWKAPLPVLKTELMADTPSHWHPIFEASMTEDVERQVLHVLCDRLRRWWAPGALLLGDAAHTMSPIGGQGLTVAIRDAIVSANHIIRAHRDGSELSDSLCQSIEAERRPEIEELQAFQQRAGRINDAPPILQWLMANAIIPIATKIQGASYLRQLQHGVTQVRMEFPVPIRPSSPS